MISVILCDDQEMVREGLGTILKSALDVQVVALARDGREAVELCERHHPDVVLMDLKMPNMNGIVATRQIRERTPSVRVLALTTYDADEWVFDAIRAGVAGYLLKDSPAEQLLDAIRGTAAGMGHVDPSVAPKLLARIAHGEHRDSSTLDSLLTEREREILGHLADGLSNAAIAKRLFLSEGTVRNYLTVVFEKLNVADRTQAAILAVKHGIVARKPSSK